MPAGYSKFVRSMTQTVPELSVISAPPRGERILSQCRLFVGEPPRLPATFVQLDRRRALFGQGSPAEYVFFLGAGRARMVKTAPDRTITLAYFGPGDLLGEDALFSGTHDAEVRVVDALEALRVPVAAFRQALQSDAQLAFRLLELVNHRKRNVEQRLESLLTKTVEARVAEFLVAAAERFGVADGRGTLIGVKFTHLEIASYVGSTRETVTLVLGDLKRRGILMTEHRRMIVRDAEALRRVTV